MSIIVFLIILSFLVIVHELGHFLMARLSGVKVEEFGLGYPPRALTMFTDKKGTDYTLNWLPFGGFVRLFGEDDDLGGDKRAFVNHPAWKKMLIVLAGATVNFLVGAIAFGAIYTKVGIPTPMGHVEVGAVAPGSPAEQAGLKEGDQITGVVVDGQTRSVTTNNAFIDIVGKEAGKTIGIVVTGQTFPVTLRVRTPEETPADQGALGVVISDSSLKRFPLWQMPFRGMAVGMKEAVNFGVMIVQALGQMLSQLFTQGKVPADVAGPVGIAYAAEKSGILTEGWLSQFYFLAILSINLAIMNVLPIPALDGGRAVFIAVELFTRKRVKPSVERMVNAGGFMALLLLIVLITIRDVKHVAEALNLGKWVQGLF